MAAEEEEILESGYPRLTSLPNAPTIQRSNEVDIWMNQHESWPDTIRERFVAVMVAVHDRLISRRGRPDDSGLINYGGEFCAAYFEFDSDLWAIGYYVSLSGDILLLNVFRREVTLVAETAIVRGRLKMQKCQDMGDDISYG